MSLFQKLINKEEKLALVGLYQSGFQFTHDKFPRNLAYFFQAHSGFHGFLIN